MRSTQSEEERCGQEGEVQSIWRNTLRATQRNHRLQQARIARDWRQRDLADLLGASVESVKRWEKGNQQPSLYFQVKLCNLFGKNLEELGLEERNASSASPGFVPSEIVSVHTTESLALWGIPYSRNPHFTGRDELLKLLEQHFLPPSSPKLVATHQARLICPIALKGLGGIGKTQIALEYAYRAREQQRYTHSFWICANDEETILSSFVSLTQRVPSLVADKENDQHKLVAAAICWLEQCQQPWLLIFDNVDDLELVQQYFPHQGNGCLLLTTRTHAIEALASSVEVEKMGVMEGTSFLLHRTKRLAATDEERNEAANVVIALDSLPLALDQAGAYIEETGCCFGDYLKLYHKHSHALLARRGIQATRYPDSVATIWSLPFQQIEQRNPAAADLLRLCAFLSPDHISEDFLIAGAPYWPPQLQQAVGDLFGFNQMLEDLLRFSLVKRLVGERMLSIPRLVQVIQRERMDLHEQRSWATCVIHGINAIFPQEPKHDPAAWSQYQRYLEQVQMCEVLARQYESSFAEAADVLNRAGIYLCERSLCALADSLFQRSLSIR